jgi:hypothetical protein
MIDVCDGDAGTLSPTSLNRIDVDGAKGVSKLCVIYFVPVGSVVSVKIPGTAVLDSSNTIPVIFVFPVVVLNRNIIKLIGKGYDISNISDVIEDPNPTLLIYAVGVDAKLYCTLFNEYRFRFLVISKYTKFKKRYI